MSISAALSARLGFDRHILTVAMDQHNVHCMTEDMLDEWFRSLKPSEKAAIFDAHLGAPDLPSAHADGSILPRPFATGGIVALNAVTEGLPALGAPRVCEVQPLDPGRRDGSSALRTQLRESLDQLDQVDLPAPSHAPSVAPLEWPRHFNCKSRLGLAEVPR